MHDSHVKACPGRAWDLQHTYTITMDHGIEKRQRLRGSLRVFLSPLVLLAAAEAPALRPLALRPRPSLLLGSTGAGAGGWGSSMSSWVTRSASWGAGWSAGRGATVFTSWRWLSKCSETETGGIMGG